jgi:hypothetical protein
MTTKEEFARKQKALSEKSEAERQRSAFESAIRSLMYAPQVYGSRPEKKANSMIGILDAAIRESQS